MTDPYFFLYCHTKNLRVIFDLLPLNFFVKASFAANPGRTCPSKKEAFFSEHLGVEIAVSQTTYCRWFPGAIAPVLHLALWVIIVCYALASTGSVHSPSLMNWQDLVVFFEDTGGAAATQKRKEKKHL